MCSSCANRSGAAEICNRYSLLVAKNEDFQSDTKTINRCFERVNEHRNATAHMTLSTIINIHEARPVVSAKHG